MTDRLTIPEALGDEDGETYYLQGHVDPALAVLSVVTYHMSYTDAHEGYELLLGEETRSIRDGSGAWHHTRTWSDQIDHANDLLNSVEHYWAKPNPDDDERMLPAEPDDEFAEAWTRVRLA